MGYNTVCFSENTCQESLILITSLTDSLSIIHQVYTATYNFNNDWSYRIYPLSCIFPVSTNNPAYTLYTVHELKIIPILPAQTVLSSKLYSHMWNVKMLVKRLLNEMQFTGGKQSEHFLPC